MKSSSWTRFRIYHVPTPSSWTRFRIYRVPTPSSRTCFGIYHVPTPSSWTRFRIYRVPTPSSRTCFGICGNRHKSLNKMKGVLPPFMGGLRGDKTYWISLITSKTFSSTLITSGVTLKFEENGMKSSSWTRFRIYTISCSSDSETSSEWRGDWMNTKSGFWYKMA